MTQRIHKLFAGRITETGDFDSMSYPALFLAPEQVLYGLAYNDNTELDES